MNPIYYEIIDEAENLVEKAELKHQRKLLRENLNVLDLPDREFKKLFRMSKILFQNLVQEVSFHMEEGHRNTKLSVETRILTALRFFATGSYQKGVGAEYFIGIAQQTTSNCITEVASALQTIAHRYIKFPTLNEDMQRVQFGFMDKFYFPGVLGAIDGTHIAILQPTENEHLYLNRKGFHSKNVQIVCDSDLNILNVAANFGGATHDAFIWRNSTDFEHFAQNYVVGNQRSWVIGDSGYPLQPWLLVPFQNAIEGTPEHRYNTALNSARNCVERCIGRFRCLLHERMLRYTPEKAGLIINACCVLHNMCVGDGPLEDDIIREERNDEGNAGDGNNLFDAHILQEGQQQRQNVVNLYFAN